MRTGKMDQQIFFAALVETNTGGELVQTWPEDSPPDMEWAEVITPKGSQAFESARINSRETLRVRIHYRDDIIDTHRLRWENQIYYMKHIDRSQRRKGYLWFTAEVVGAR